jgi:1,4-alpha-glucan branching enzyme
MAGAAVAFAAALGAACAAVRPQATVATPAGIRFAFVDPEAGSVVLAGTFNQWSLSAHPLARMGSRGVWTIVVALAPGEHRYMFVVDGERWVMPPMAEDYLDDGFGSKNGVVVVRPAVP